jgi:peptide/nickel transport system substrate-binding protein
MSRFKTLFIRTGLALSVLFAMIGCATTGAPLPQATSAPSTQAPPAQSKAGGVLNYAVDTEPDKLDPNLSGGRGGKIVFSQIYDNLIALDPATQTFVPWLAKSWEVSPDGLHYTFHLRQDVKFHDGTPFNAAAVKFNFDRHHDPASASEAEGAIGFYDSSDVVDEYTVRINLKKPLAPFLDYVSDVYKLNSPAAVQKWGADYSRHPTGTGAFKFVEWMDNDHITLERNSEYQWPPQNSPNQGPAYLDRVIFRNIPEPGTRIAALENGEVQAAVNVPAVDAARLEQDPKFRLIVGYVPGITFHWSLNIHKAPTDELAVRQAMNYGVDREAIVKTVYGPYQAIKANTAAYNILVPNTFGFDPTAAAIYKYDPEKAKQLLEDAGWKVNTSTGIREKDGKPLEIIMNTWEKQSVLEVAQAQLRNIGMDIKVGVLPVATVNDLQRKEASNGSPSPAARADPDEISPEFHSRNLGTWNLIFLNDPKMDNLLDSGASEVDRDKRKEIYSQIQHLIMEQAMIFPLYNRDNVVAINEAVQGLTLDRGFFPRLHDVWLQK